MKRLYAIVSCDVVDSTSLTREGIIKMREDIVNELFRKLRRFAPGFYGRVVRGDTIEICLDEPNLALRVALAMKAWFKSWASAQESSERMSQIGIRYSIGIGEMRYVDYEEDIMDGEAIYIAGRNLDYISANGLYSAFGFNYASDEYEIIQRLARNLLAFIDDLFEQMTTRQSLVVHYLLLGCKEVEIAGLLSISQAAVSLRARNAGWALIKASLETFNRIEFERYV